jgi:hypothetical protein
MTTGPIETFAQWQREHAAALEELQDAQRAYHRTVAATAFQGTADEPSAEEMRRASLEARKLGSSSIIIRMSAIRKLAGEAADNGLLEQELAEGSRDEGGLEQNAISVHVQGLP